MPRARWNERFLATTRGRIVALLRRGSATVNELADSLELTDNAVRAHLAGLERDGLVEQEGVRRGTGKPSHVFRLTGEAASLFPRAYAYLASELVRELKQRDGDERLAATLLEVGRRAGAGARVPGGDALERLSGVRALLEAHGADVEILQQASSTTVSGHDCPLATVVLDEPRACSFLEGFLEGALEAPVRQHCEHGPRPRCRFEVELPRPAE